MKTKSKRLILAVCLLLVSAVLVGTASFAWFSMNTEVTVDGIEVEAYSDSLFLEISMEKTSGYDTSVSIEGEKQYIRLAKHGFVSTAYTLTETAISTDTDYDGSTVYYKKVELADSYYKYVIADDLEEAEGVAGLYKNPVFIQITDASATMQSGVVYYAKTEFINEYTPVATVAGDAATGLYTLGLVYTLVGGTDTKAEDGVVYYEKSGDVYTEVENVEADTTVVSTYYTAAEIEPEAADATKDNSAKYYEEGSDGRLYEKNLFAPATNVKGLYTLAAQQISTLTSFTGKAFVKNANADEYSLLGDFTAANLTDMLYFGRAYSDTVNGTDIGNEGETLNVVKAESAGNYRYMKSIYLRNAVNTNDSHNLQAAFNVSGTNVLTSAVRVVLVVYDVSGSTDTFVNYVEYSKATGSVTYKNGNNIVGTLAGNTAQTLRADVYVYYDGTDASASNATSGVLALTANKIEIKFTIDGPSYN